MSTKVSLTKTLYFSSCGSIPEEQQKRAGRSVWYDRRVRNAEAAGSNPARSTTTVAPNTSTNRVLVFNNLLMC